VGLNGFLRSLRLRAHDFVVIKMDIEGGEYETIRNLVAEPSIAETVDEIMVEVHYAHPEMHWAVSGLMVLVGSNVLGRCFWRR
jgi:hypothetical protein